MGLWLWGMIGWVSPGVGAPLDGCGGGTLSLPWAGVGVMAVGGGTLWNALCTVGSA